MRQHNRIMPEKNSTRKAARRKDGCGHARRSFRDPVPAAVRFPSPSLFPKPKEGPGAWQVAGGRVGRAQASEAGFPATKQTTKQWGASQHKARRQPTPTHTLGWYWLGLILFLSFKARRPKKVHHLINHMLHSSVYNKSRSDYCSASAVLRSRPGLRAAYASQPANKPAARRGGATGAAQAAHLGRAGMCFHSLPGTRRGKGGSACFPSAFLAGAELARRAEACRRVAERA